MSENSRYSLKVSTEYIYSWLAIELIFILGAFAIIYYLVYKPFIIDSSNFEFYSKLIWGIFAGCMFLIFASTYMITNSRRYWLDMKFIEVWNIYFRKKRTTIMFKDVVEVKISRMPVLSTAFNYGTIKIYTKRKNNDKIKLSLRVIGVKYPTEIYLDILERCKTIDKEEEKIRKPEVLIK